MKLYLLCISYYFVFYLKSHLYNYPIPYIINYWWNIGFLLGITIISQIITGLLLSLYYSQSLLFSFSSVFFIIRDIYYGWSLPYLHSLVASFVFLLLYLHLLRALVYNCYHFHINTWFNGIILLLLLMDIGFIGYVLPFGQMSFWGATVITNLLSSFPSLIEWLCGGYYVYNPTFHRFFLYHLSLPFICIGLLSCHLFYLHFLSSNNPLKSTNNWIVFFPIISLKDLFSTFILLSFISVQVFFGISYLSHSDNALEACPLLTPLHIVPEWYFLIQYSMLKAVSNKTAGFIILLTSILIIFLFGEITNHSSFFSIFLYYYYHQIPSMTYNLFPNSLYIGYLYSGLLFLSLFISVFILLIWIGNQFPQEIFLSYARILTFYYYFLIFCILFTSLP
jgi:ubiquinol-cytochrome c reductase cytochrome b subunit